MKYRISDVASINESSISKSTYIGSVNYVDTSSVISGNFNGYRHYPSISEAPSRARRLVSKEDTVISTVRPNMKHVGFISSKSDCIYSTGFAVVSPKKDKIDPYYLYLFLSSNRVTEVLQSIGETSTSTYPSVKPSDIGNLVIDMPPLDEQHLIANRIRLIDEKKNQNSQINANLDEIKTAYFDKSFNQQMQSNLNGKLKNITKITSGKRPNKKSDTKSSKDKYPIVGASKVMGYTDNYLYNEPILTTGRVGTHGIIQRFREPVWVSDNSFVFKTDHEDYLFEILNHWINYSALNRGSTQPLITQTDLKNIDIYVPTESELKKFERVSRILTNLQFSLIKQNRRLDQIKKTLLNKLLL